MICWLNWLSESGIKEAKWSLLNHNSTFTYQNNHQHNWWYHKCKGPIHICGRSLIDILSNHYIIYKSFCTEKKSKSYHLLSLQIKTRHIGYCEWPINKFGSSWGDIASDLNINTYLNDVCPKQKTFLSLFTSYR